MNLKNYDYVIIGSILTCHFIYLGNFSNLFFYEIYDYYLQTGNHLRDFFWYPSNALINKINVFDTYLKEYNFSSFPPGYPPPNYSLLHTLIFIFFGVLPLPVARIFYLFTNLILLFFIYKQLKNICLNNNIIFFLFCLFLFSPTLILCLKMGQYTVFCLWGFVTYFNNNKLFFKFLGLLIATAKYTFAPIIGLYLLFEKKFMMFFFLITSNVLAVLFYSIYFEISFVNALINPILMGWKTQAIGAGDLLSFLGNHPKFPFNVIVVLLVFFLLKYLIYFNSKRSAIYDLTVVCILTLMSLKHLSYDYIFIFPTTLMLLEKISLRSKIILMIIIFYYLFILPWSIIEPIRYTKTLIFFNMTLNFILLFIVLSPEIKNKYYKVIIKYLQYFKIKI